MPCPTTPGGSGKRWKISATICEGFAGRAERIRRACSFRIASRTRCEIGIPSLRSSLASRWSSGSSRTFSNGMGSSMYTKRLYVETALGPSRLKLDLHAHLDDAVGGEREEVGRVAGV